MRQQLRVAVLISGRGSNLQALLKATNTPHSKSKICLVVSSNPDAKGLLYAQNNNIHTEVLVPRTFENRNNFEHVLHTKLQNANIQLVCLAGFMYILSADFLSLWPDRVLNIHPSLLPAFKGLNTHTRVLAAGVRWSGCTVHFVRPAVDAGPILVQAVVPVYDEDSPEILAERVLQAEHRCYPLALRLIAEGRVHIIQDRVTILPKGLTQPSDCLINPSE